MIIKCIFLILPENIKSQVSGAAFLLTKFVLLLHPNGRYEDYWLHTAEVALKAKRIAKGLKCIIFLQTNANYLDCVKNVRFGREFYQCRCLISTSKLVGLAYVVIW